MPKNNHPPTTTSPTLTHQHPLDPRADGTGDAPELCGFHEHTASARCAPGKTCKFNTDLYAVGCCSDDVCDWRTSCCDYNPSVVPATPIFGAYTPTCGGPVPELIAYCTNPAVPYCGTNRWENGFTQYYCTRDPATLVNSVFFRSAGETAARAGLPRLTGSAGPGGSTQGPTTATVTVTATETVGSSGPGPGAIAGSVVGGVAFGVVAALLGVFLVGCFRRRRKKAGFGSMAMRGENDGGLGAGGPEVDDTGGRLQNPYGMGGGAGGRHELQVHSGGRGLERQELPVKTT